MCIGAADRGSLFNVSHKRGCVIWAPPQDFTQTAGLKWASIWSVSLPLNAIKTHNFTAYTSQFTSLYRKTRAPVNTYGHTQSRTHTHALHNYGRRMNFHIINVTVYTKWTMYRYVFWLSTLYVKHDIILCGQSVSCLRLGGLVIYPQTIGVLLLVQFPHLTLTSPDSGTHCCCVFYWKCTETINMTVWTKMASSWCCSTITTRSFSDWSSHTFFIFSLNDQSLTKLIWALQANTWCWSRCLNKFQNTTERGWGHEPTLQSTLELIPREIKMLNKNMKQCTYWSILFCFLIRLLTPYMNMLDNTFQRAERQTDVQTTIIK